MSHHKEVYLTSFTATLLGFFLFVLPFTFVFDTFGQTGNPPQITNVRAENIYAPGAQILWSTDIPSDSRVRFGVSPGNYSILSNFRCDGIGMVTEHCVFVDDLTPSTIYYYKVESMSEGGADSYSAGYQFVSDSSGGGNMAVPVTPSNMQADLLEGGDVALLWNDNSTNENTFHVKFRPQGGSFSALATLNPDEISFLYSGQPNGTYEYYVQACNSNGCSGFSNIASVTKGASGGGPTESAVIMNIRIADITSSGAKVLWDTDIPADSRVAYGITINYTNFSTARCDGGGLVINHCVILSELLPQTPYHIKVESINEGGIDNWVSGNEFLTLPTSGGGEGTSTTTNGGTENLPDTTPPPSPGVISAIALSPTSIDISWSASTDSYGNGEQISGINGYKIYKNGIYLGSTGSLTYRAINLTPNTSYSFTIAAYDVAGNVSGMSSPDVATTPQGSNVTSVATSSPTNQVSYKVDVGEKICLDGNTRAKVTFQTTPAGGGTFVVTQNVGDMGRIEPGVYSLPNSEYTWRGEPKSGFYGDATGAFSISKLLNCTSLSQSTTTQTVKPRAYIGIIVDGNSVPEGGIIRGNVILRVTVEHAEKIKVFAKNTKVSTSLPIFLGDAVLSTSSPSRWRLPFDTRRLSDGEYRFFTRLISSSGEYAGDGMKVLVRNSTLVAVNDPTTNTSLETVSTQTKPTDANITSTNTQNDTFVGSFSDIEQVLSLVDITPIDSQERFLREILSMEEVFLQQENEDIFLENPDLLIPISRTVSIRYDSIKKLPTVIEDRVTTGATDVFIDSDEDGISDFDEINIYGTDPDIADSDEDGISDAEEVINGTSPTKRKIDLEPEAERIVFENPKEVQIVNIAPKEIFTVEKVAAESLKTEIDGSQGVEKIRLEGRGLPNSFLTIYIFSTPIVATVKTDSEGKWTYILDKELEDGNHEAYVAMTDREGKILTASDPIPFIKTALAVGFEEQIQLAQTGSPQTSFSRTLPILLVFFGGIIILVLLFLGIRRKSHEEEAALVGQSLSNEKDTLEKE